jgi:hypothetical protein
VDRFLAYGQVLIGRLHVGFVGYWGPVSQTRCDAPRTRVIAAIGKQAWFALMNRKSWTAACGSPEQTAPGRRADGWAWRSRLQHREVVRAHWRNLRGAARIAQLEDAVPDEEARHQQTRERKQKDAAQGLNARRQQVAVVLDRRVFVCAGTRVSLQLRSPKVDCPAAIQAGCHRPNNIEDYWWKEMRRVPIPGNYSQSPGNRRRERSPHEGKPARISG